MKNQDPDAAGALPEKVVIQYEQLLEEIRNHNSQLLTMDSVFIPIFFAILATGMTDAEGKTECLAILVVAVVVTAVFAHISCRGLTMIETLKAQVNELEMKYGIAVLRSLNPPAHLSGYNERGGWTKVILERMFIWGRAGPPVVIFVMLAMLFGLAFYACVCWWKFFR